ncbi:hypothetical protein [Burkholderia gladioli]|uniref:hypothetical protein n=1 Tax=Burkholderia gladioli TaxID=28095 RepID=UPI00163E2002|nr:hypothetical protein [Burkholderia gladioli]
MAKQLKPSQQRLDRLDASAAEPVFAAYLSLEKNERQAVTKASEAFVRGTERGDPCDLLHEALVRLADGRRVWPAGVEFCATLIMCMRSLSSHGRRSVKRSNETQRSVDELETSGVEFQGVIPSVEETLLAAERHREIMQAIGKENAAMAEDPVGRCVFNGIISGASAEEMQRRSRLSRSEYRAARQRAIRRLERVFKRNDSSRNDQHNCPCRGRRSTAETPANNAQKAAAASRNDRRGPRI